MNKFLQVRKNIFSISLFSPLQIVTLLLLFGNWHQCFGQTTLAVGDVAIAGFNSANPDKIAIILLKNITANTVINITDNGFTSGATGRTGEGFLTYTAPSNQVAGTVLTWTNGQVITGTGWSSATPSNFALNGSGDQLFIFQGSTANWATQSGINLLFGGNFGIALNATSAASNTVQPTALSGSGFLNLPTSTFSNSYFSNSSVASTSVTLSNTASALFALFGDASKWFGNSGTSATFPTYSITITSTTPTITAIGTLSAVNTNYGTASATPSTFTVSGVSLNNDVLISPSSSNFEISKTDANSGYANTQTLTQTGGIVNTTTIYVRLKASATVVGSPYSGDIILSSTGATSVNVPTVASSVSAKNLTITGVTVNEKVYDGNSIATFSGTPNYAGLENGETFTVAGSPTAYFIDAFVGNSKTVNFTGYTSPSSNYIITQPSLSANITPAPLTVLTPFAQNKEYNGNTIAILSGTLNGIIGAEDVTLNATGTFATSSVGNGISVTSTSTLSGTNAANYTLTQPTSLSANITSKSLSITGLSGNNKIFDNNTVATLSGTATLNGIVVGDEVNVSLDGTPTANFSQSTVGENLPIIVSGYSISGTASGNYLLSQPTGLTASITNSPSPVVNSLFAASAIYGEIATLYTISATNSPTSYNATGLPDGLVINTTTGAITGTPTSILGSPFSVTISATNAGGTGSATLIYTINKKTITITTALAQNKTYNRTSAATITGTLVGVVGADVVSIIGTGIFAQINVGNGISVTSTATLGGGDATKYILTQPSGLTANITKKELTTTGAIASNKVYDANNLATISGVILDGVIGPDDATVSGNGIFTSVDAADNIMVNTSLVLGGTDANNYSITQPSGISANITKAPLTISGLTADNKIYDGNATATLNGGTPTLNGIINSDDVSVSGTVLATFNNKNVGIAKPVLVSGYDLMGSKAGNYSIGQPSGLTANISALGLTITNPIAQSKVFDGTTIATITGILTGIIATDVVTFTGMGVFASSAIGNGIEVTPNITLGGVGASNYVIIQPTGLTANITAAPSLSEVILPRFMQGINGTNNNRLPFTYRVTLNNLIPNATYRFYNSVVTAADMPTSNGAGNVIFPSSTTWIRSSGPSLSSAGNYGEFLTDANGSYTGWFITEPTGNATRFLPGNDVFMRILLNNGAGGTVIATRLTTTNSVKIINLVNAAGANNGTGLRGNSGATDKNFVFAYDNTAGTGRPISGTFIENDGVAEVTSFASFYGSNVDGISGAYGLIIPNDNANGVRRIEQRDFSTGAIAGCAATDDDGTWVSGANTANPASGTTAVVITSGDAPLNTCQVFNIAPTIVIDVATTTNYIDGGVATNISGSYPLSAVINDLTDPAQTLGVDFTIGDTETAIGSLIVTVSSNNIAVVPNANLNLTGTGSSRNLKIIPVSVGYATITVTVNDGTTNTTFILSYAASQAANITTNSHFHTGKSDASTAIKIDNNLMLIADDEDQTIRLYDRNNSGLPINSFDFTSVLGLTDISGGSPREVDIEASMKINNSIYWLGSGSNASSGNNRPNRNRVFKTDIAGTGSATTLTYVNRYDFLKQDILAWDANNTHGKGANYFGLVVSAASGVIPESALLDGFNIEGIEMAPDNTTAYIAFRAPQVIPSNRKKALIIPITNFTTILAPNGGTIGSATFGVPIELNLGERGIREIRKNAANEYLIIAGPADAATGISPKDFKLFTWTGKSTDEPIQRSINLNTLNVNGSFESIVDVPASLNSNTSIQLLIDNGDAVYYNDATIAKDLSQANWKKFRSETVTLSVPVIEMGTITTNICKGATLAVPFSINNETFNNGNIFTAQLSDATGSFANPTSIGTLTNVNSGSIATSIPINAITGTEYRIRIVSSNPSIIGADNGINITINAIPNAPTVSANPASIVIGQSSNLSASGCAAGIINWSFTSSTINPIAVTPLSTTNYTATCTLNGCQSEISSPTTITVSSGSPCQNQVVLTSTVDDYSSGVQLKQANISTGNIQATNKITNGATVIYQAKTIQLLPGFKADSGTIFKAEIGGCN